MTLKDLAESIIERINDDSFFISQDDPAGVKFILDVENLCEDVIIYESSAKGD